LHPWRGWATGIWQTGDHTEARDIPAQHAPSGPPSSRDFDEAFDRLKSILETYGRTLHVVADNDTAYGDDTAPEAERDPTTWFGAVRVGKAYVSSYLMPIYVEAALLAGISPALARRMHGESCFHFTRVDEELFAVLADLARRSFDRTAGDPAWGGARREEHDMAYRKAMSDRRRQRASTEEVTS
jgi:hypothetical protein